MDVPIVGEDIGIHHRSAIDIDNFFSRSPVKTLNPQLATLKGMQIKFGRRDLHRRQDFIDYRISNNIRHLAYPSAAIVTGIKLGHSVVVRDKSLRSANGLG